jgi:gentisate 1,2-dioxygenase
MRNIDQYTVSRILGGAAERLQAECSSPSRRETASSVYHVISGCGYSTVGGEKLIWEKGDTFCVPSCAGESVYLYRFDDKPMLTALGFYRTEDMEPEQLVSA